MIFSVILYDYIGRNIFTFHLILYNKPFIVKTLGRAHISWYGCMKIGIFESQAYFSQAHISSISSEKILRRVFFYEKYNHEFLRQCVPQKDLWNFRYIVEVTKTPQRHHIENLKDFSEELIDSKNSEKNAWLKTHTSVNVFRIFWS